MGEETRAWVDVSIERSLDARLDALVQLTRRKKSDLVQDAITEFLDRIAWRQQEIAAAMTEADQGRTVEHDVVRRWLETWGSGTEGGAPRIE